MVFAFIMLSIVCFMACDKQETFDGEVPVYIESLIDFQTRVAMNSAYSTQGGQVRIARASGRVDTLPSDDERLSYSEVDTTGLGRKVMTITFEEGDISLTYDLEIHVYLDCIESIKGITGMSKALRQNEVFNMNNIQVVFEMVSGTERVIPFGDTGLEISPVDTSMVGLHHLYIGYGDLTPYIFEYVVYDASSLTYVGAEIKGSFAKKVNVGSVYDASSIVLEVTLQIAGIDALQVQTYAFDDLVVTTPDTSSAGTKKLIATFYDDLLDVTYSGAATVVVK